MTSPTAHLAQSVAQNLPAATAAAPVEQSLLGQQTQYPTQYCPEILFAIARKQSRQVLGDSAGIAQGMDWWHVFELSWLDSTGKPMVAIGRLAVPANSVNIIESKSLKLYFNGLNFCTFVDKAQLIACVETDLSAVACAPVTLQLFAPNDLPIQQLNGLCIDNLALGHQLLDDQPWNNEPDAQLLQLDTGKHAEVVEQTLYSHLLRSNCPITNQPDWASIVIRYQGKKINASSLLAYLLSYRKHADFHEQCIEKIYADIDKRLQPTRLMVYAMYTRRGGLDINPCRVSHIDWLVEPIRLARQ